MRLYSSVIKLLSLHTVTIPRPGAQHAHGAFFDILRQVDPALATEVHAIEGKGKRKPFTLSPIQGLPANRRNGQEKAGTIHLREGWECWLRVTLLDETLFRKFIEYFLDSPSPKGTAEIRLGDAHFLVSEILTTPGSHPWAGFTTLEALQKRLDEPAPDSLSFEFHSPTSFKLGDHIELIPYPKLLFGNLATAWKNLSGEDMVEAIEKYAQQNLQLTPHRLERRALTLSNQPQLGSLGKVEYRLLHPEDTPLARALNLLADLAFYTGVGRKTTQGMGMTRRVETDLTKGAANG
jgi:CRISPR-associated endoribonuclease Cas6